MRHPTCFISYAWEDEKHKSWVNWLSNTLRRNGIETFLDQHDLYLGDDLVEFYLTLTRIDFVLIICTPEYRKRVMRRNTGVYHEYRLITEELFYKTSNPHKFIPVLRSGTIDQSIPPFLRSLIHIDFVDESKFLDNIEKLCRHIFNQPEIKKVLIGERPVFNRKWDLCACHEKHDCDLPKICLRDNCNCGRPKYCDKEDDHCTRPKVCTDLNHDCERLKAFAHPEDKIYKTKRNRAVFR